jgi:hypothetical protein
MTRHTQWSRTLGGKSLRTGLFYAPRRTVLMSSDDRLARDSLRLGFSVASLARTHLNTRNRVVILPAGMNNLTAGEL